MNNIHNIDVKTARSWIDNGEAIIIDVRETDEYSGGHIEGAINIPLSSLNDHIEQIKNLQTEKIGKKITKKIILQCRAGVRSMRACELLHKEGFEHDLWNLEGGILAWQELGV